MNVLFSQIPSTTGYYIIKYYEFVSLKSEKNGALRWLHCSLYKWGYFIFKSQNESKQPFLVLLHFKLKVLCNKYI